MVAQLLQVMTFALFGFALILIVEGLIYALFPVRMKALLSQMGNVPADTLRSGGLVAAISGFGLIALLRL